MNKINICQKLVKYNPIGADEFWRIVNRIHDVELLEFYGYLKCHGASEGVAIEIIDYHKLAGNSPYSYYYDRLWSDFKQI